MKWMSLLLLLASCAADNSAPTQTHTYSGKEQCFWYRCRRGGGCEEHRFEGKLLDYRREVTQATQSGYDILGGCWENGKQIGP